MIEYPGKFTTAKVFIDSIESECVSQIIRFINHEAFTNPVAIMPDCHSGKGSVIGFTMELTDKVIPNIIGVDIGCAVLSTNIGKINLNLESLDIEIRKRIPFGANHHSEPIINMEKEFPWKESTELCRRFVMNYNNKFKTNYNPIEYSYDWFIEHCRRAKIDSRLAKCSLGTLGGGNHYIEIGKSKNTQELWITIHSGSRKFGLEVCNYHQKLAEKKIVPKEDFNEQVKLIKEEFKHNKKQIKCEIEKLKLANKHIKKDELAYLENDKMMNYLFDMIFAQNFAQFNRQIMMNIVFDILNIEPIETIESVHNYINFEDLIIRKGAISSYSGQKMIIPFNMKDGMIICDGKSDPEWNYSAPHGAGRIMSRTKAKERIKLKDFQDDMAGIYSTSVNKATIDESRFAYKDSELIKMCIVDTANIIDYITPIMNMKA